MLKFSGYSYLIRGQPLEVLCEARHPPMPLSERNYYARVSAEPAAALEGPAAEDRGRPITRPGLRVEMTLEQACPSEY
jgi:hypothetical protein